LARRGADGEKRELAALMREALDRLAAITPAG
jgi:hypothetical protein